MNGLAPFARGSFVEVLALLAAFAVLSSPLAAEAVERQAATPAAASASQTGDSASNPAPTVPSDLKDATARLAKTASPSEYAAALDAFSTSLRPFDALALLSQCTASASPEFREPLLVKAGNLALLLGLFGDAASRYEAAAALDPEPAGKDRLLLRAARSFLAAGDQEKGTSIASDVVLRSQDPDTVAAASLVGAWSLALQGRATDAHAIAVSVAGKPAAPPGLRREARFILWLCAPADQKPEASNTLATEFPGSPEALIASGAASAPPLPHWYLGDLIGAAKTPVAASPTVAIPAAAAPATQPSVPTSKNKRLQVGYFTLEENARALKEELTSKRFDASVETKSKAGGKRWIVVVEGGKDTARTMLALKDAGYESYVTDY